MASLLDDPLAMPRAGLLGLPAPDITPPDDRTVSQGDALADVFRGVAERVRQERAKSAEMGLWNDETGLPTAKGLLDATQQYTQGLLLGTNTPGIRAYHGSPHSFDRFSTERIGTGEGAQAYGHGLYFAEREGVAKGYRDNLTVKPMTPELKAAQDAYNKAYWDVPTGGTQAEFDAAIARRDAAQAEMRRVQTEWEAAPGPKGSMYEVNIAANPEHMLHWDKPLSEQHPVVRERLYKAGALPDPVMEEAVGHFGYSLDEFRALPFAQQEALIARVPASAASYRSNPTGQQILENLVGPTQRGRAVAHVDAAETLREAGIPGIRYLDQGSRGAGEGSHNLVVFDDATIEILRKYGLAGLMLGGGAAATQQQ